MRGRFPTTLRRREVLKATAILIATLAVYLPAYRAGYIWNDWDLTDNIVLQDMGLFRVWLTSDSINYWPMTWTSYWLEYQFWGLNPIGYHIVNVVLHAISSLLIWRILVRLGIPAAWFSALIFAIHPVNVESVAWLTQRKNTLCLLFFLSSVLLFLRWDQGGRRSTYGWSVFLFLLAMFSKGAAAPMPVVLLLCLWWRHGTVTGRHLFRTLPFLLVAVGMSLVEIWFQYVRAIGEETVRDDPFLSRLASAGWVVWFYASKAVLPIRLAFVYPRWEIDWRDWWVHLPNLALLGVLGAAWWSRQSWGGPLFFAVGYFVTMLAPVLGFFNIYFMKFSFVADHYQYLALIGLIALMVGACWHVCRRAGPRYVRLANTAGVVLAGTLGYLTWHQTHIYHDDATLWRDTIRKNPECTLAQYNLGVFLSKRGDMVEARRCFESALRLDPADARAHNNLANILRMEGDLDAAIEHYAQAVRLEPGRAVAHRNFGDALQAKGLTDAAISEYRRALRVAPRCAAAHVNLAILLEGQGEIGEAIWHYQEAARVAPDMAAAHRNLARLMLSRGRRSLAVEHIRSAELLAPSFSE